MENLNIILNALNAKPSGNGFIAKCPAHDDNTPSLSIKEGDNGKVLLHCHAGCKFEDIKEKLVVMGVWKNSKKKSNFNWSSDKTTIEYIYEDKNNQPVMKIDRIEVEGKKTFINHSTIK